MKKINAYTILEITVAMIISGICMATAYTVYQLVGSSFKQYDNKNEQIAESVLLDKLLTRDFMDATEVRAKGEGFRIHRKDVVVDYDFEGDLVIRTAQDLPADTFLVYSRDITTYFQNRTSSGGSLVDKVVFNTLLNGESLGQCYSKRYSSEELFNAIQSNK